MWNYKIRDSSGQEIQTLLTLNATRKKLKCSEYSKEFDIYKSTVSVDWVDRKLKPIAKNEDRFALFCDNLTAQVSEEFKKADINGESWFSLPNATDLWQPVDVRYVELIKVLITQNHHKWLDSEENTERWYDSEEKFPSKE